MTQSLREFTGRFMQWMQNSARWLLTLDQADGLEPWVHL